jgi:DNA-binding MarR family transcriptional regulator
MSSREPGSLEAAQAIADGLWERFRLLAMTLDKVDSFVAMAPGAPPLPESSDVEEKSRSWSQLLADRPEEARAVANDLVLRCFRVAVAPGQFELLSRLHQEESISFAELEPETGLNRLSLSEQVNDLIQVGLATREPTTVQLTAAGQGLVDFLRAVQERLFDRIQKPAPRPSEQTRRRRGKVV